VISKSCSKSYYLCLYFISPHDILLEIYGSTEARGSTTGAIATGAIATGAIATAATECRKRVMAHGGNIEFKECL
jgi:hypothetical protein